MYQIKILILLITLLFIGCGLEKGSPNNQNETFVLTSNKINNLDDAKIDLEYVDLPFTVIEYSQWNGYQNSKIQALSGNDTLELIISLKLDIPNTTFVKDGIKISTSGKNSDKLLNKLSTLYGLDSNNLSLKAETVLTIANLNMRKINYKKGTSTFKVFLEEDDMYGEVFLNFNFDNGIISISEKDPEYRSAIINILSE